MRIEFPIEKIFGKNPKHVGDLFRKAGLDPNRPYRANVTFQSITVEQNREDRP